MKLQEIRLTEQQLEEIRVRDAVVAGTVAVAAMMPFHGSDKPKEPTAKTCVVKVDDTKQLTDVIVKRYKIDAKQAERIVKLAKKYESKTAFPKARDILAIIGIESSFNQNAKSNLKNDPAIGLTQIRPRIWKINKTELAGDIEKQIAHGSRILKSYHDSLKSIDDTVHAYNVGITNFRKGKHNLAYVEKFKKERKFFA